MGTGEKPVVKCEAFSETGRNLDPIGSVSKAPRTGYQSASVFRPRAVLQPDSGFLEIACYHQWKLGRRDKLPSGSFGISLDH
jgi:hypothetical protein